MDERITGVMIYYYFVCKRKLWYFCHDIRMETENEDVMLGKILDESSYKKKDKHVNIDEIKKSKAVEDAGIWQVKYYLYYLQKRGVSGLKGKIDYPLLKKSIIVEVSEKDVEILERIITEITNIKHQEIMSVSGNSKLCKKCAYYDLCTI